MKWVKVNKTLSQNSNLFITWSPLGGVRVQGLRAVGTVWQTVLAAVDPAPGLCLASPGTSWPHHTRLGATGLLEQSIIMPTLCPAIKGDLPTWELRGLRFAFCLHCYLWLVSTSLLHWTRQTVLWQRRDRVGSLLQRSRVLEALLLHPGNVLHVLHVVEAVAHRGLWHGRGGGQTVKILHQDILRRLSRQSVRHITARREIINNLPGLASLSPPPSQSSNIYQLSLSLSLSPHNVKVNWNKLID